jgi:outer membrane protein assembly factor BamB
MDSWYKNKQENRSFYKKNISSSVGDSLMPYCYGEIDFPGKIWSVPCLLSQFRVLVSCYDGFLYCYHLHDLTLVWRFDCGAAIYSSPAVLPDGSFVIGDEGGRLRRISNDGKALWVLSSDGPFHGSPSVDLLRTNVYASCYDGYLYCVDLVTGRLKWRFSGEVGFEDDIYSSPSLTKSGAIVIGSGFCLVKLDSDGNEVWRIADVSRFEGTVGIDYVSGRGIVGTEMSQMIYLFDVANGQVLKKIQAKGIMVSSPAIGLNRRAFIGSDDGTLHCVNLLTGELIWQKSVGVKFSYTPLTVTRSGHVIFSGATEDPVHCSEALHCHDWRTGAELWRLTAPKGIHSSPLITRSGELVAGSHWGKAYFFRW